MSTLEMIRKYSPCEAASDWLAGREPASAWAECERGDWMLWIAVRAGVDRRIVILAYCDIAEGALAKHWTKGRRLEALRDATDAAAGVYAHAAAAAHAAYGASADAQAAYAARVKSLRASADIVRRHITIEMVLEAIEKGNQ